MIARLRPAAGSVVLALVWLVLAWRSPTSTHHFAPLVVAMAWGFLSDVSSARDGRRAAIGGVMVAIATIGLLLAADRLQGPTLWGSRPSYPELLGFAALGGVVTLLRSIGGSQPPDAASTGDGTATNRRGEPRSLR